MDHCLLFITRRITAFKNALPPSLKVCPALVALFCFGCATLLVLAVWPGWLAVGWALVAGIGLTIGVGVLPGRRQMKIGALVAAIGLTLLHLWAPWHNFADQTPDNELRIQADIVIVTPVYNGPSQPVLEDQGNVTARIKRFRLSPKTQWRSCRGKVKVQLPDNVETKGLRQKRLRVDATVYPPPQAIFPAAFDYPRYLRISGIRRSMQVHEILAAESPHGWRRALDGFYHMRDLAIHSILTEIDSPQARRLIAAMTLGYRDALTRPLKQKFLRSGTFHIFAISGLHTGIVAAILLVLLSVFRVPNRYKYLLLPFLLAGYVAMTGGASSSVRACVMISVWCLMRVRLRPVLSANSLAVAALILLFVNPLKILAPGFVFSFVVVSSVLSGTPLIRRGWRAIRERRNWLPADTSRHSWFSVITLRGWQLLGISVFAWIGSFGLIAASNARVIPGAVPLNMLIVPLLGILLTASFLKLFVGIIPFLNQLLGVAVDHVLQGVSSLAGLAGDSPLSVSVQQPSDWIVAGFYVTMFVCLLPAWKRHTRMALLTLWICWGGSLMLPVNGHRADAAVFHGKGTGTPAVLLQTPSSNEPILVNIGGWQFVFPLREWMQSKGYDRLQAAICPTSDYGSIAGLEEIVKEFHPRTVLAPGNREEILDIDEPVHNAHGRWRVLSSFKNPPDTNKDTFNQTFRASGYRIERRLKDNEVRSINIQFFTPKGNRWTLRYEKNALGRRYLVLKKPHEDNPEYRFWRNEYAQLKLLD